MLGEQPVQAQAGKPQIPLLHTFEQVAVAGSQVAQLAVPAQRQTRQVRAGKAQCHVRVVAATAEEFVLVADAEFVTQRNTGHRISVPEKDVIQRQRDIADTGAVVRQQEPRRRGGRVLVIQQVPGGLRAPAIRHTPQVMPLVDRPVQVPTALLKPRHFELYIQVGRQAVAQIQRKTQGFAIEVQVFMAVGVQYIDIGHAAVQGNGQLALFLTVGRALRRQAQQTGHRAEVLDIQRLISRRRQRRANQADDDRRHPAELVQAFTPVRGKRKNSIIRAARAAY